jgi:hypothetical protein
VSPLPHHLASIALAACLLPGRTLRQSWSCLPRSRSHRYLSLPLPPVMAPPQPIQVLEPLPWSRSTMTPFALNELVNSRLLAPTGEGAYPVWMVPLASDREPNPPYGYVVSFIRLHERGFTAPASRFMQGLCYHYGVELHTSPPMLYRRRPPLSPSARGSWGSLQTGTSGCTCSARSSTPSPRARCGCVGRFALAA